MYDILPFLRSTSKIPEEQIADIINYLIQFKEALEFILLNISVDNLSKDLVDMLNTLGADIEKSNESREEQISQVSNKTITVTVSDVINSALFKSAVNAAVSNIKFTVNFDTGNLEYTVSST